MPTLLLVGESEVIYSPRSVLARAQRLIACVQAELVPDAGHLLNIDQPGYVKQRVVRFLA